MNTQRLSPTEQRDTLIRFLNHLLSKNHIWMKKVIRYYRDLLVEGRNLKEKHFHQLVPYLRKNTDLSVDDCWDYFRDVVGPFNPQPSETQRNDLTTFFN